MREIQANHSLQAINRQTSWRPVQPAEVLSKYSTRVVVNDSYSIRAFHSTIWPDSDLVSHTVWFFSISGSCCLWICSAASLSNVIALVTALCAMTHTSATVHCSVSAHDCSEASWQLQQCIFRIHCPRSTCHLKSMELMRIKPTIMWLWIKRMPDF